MTASVKRATILCSCLLAFAAIVCTPWPSCAEPYFYSDNTARIVSTYRADPACFTIDEAPAFAQAWPPFASYADIIARYEEAAVLPKDITSESMFADASELEFLAHWSGTPVPPAWDQRTATEKFVRTMPLVQIGILASNAATEEQPDIGALSDFYARAQWRWTADRVEIRDDDSVITISPLAWLRDRRDGQDKLLLELTEQVTTATYYANLPLLITFEEGRAVEAEYIPGFLEWALGGSEQP